MDKQRIREALLKLANGEALPSNTKKALIERGLVSFQMVENVGLISLFSGLGFYRWVFSEEAKDIISPSEHLLAACYFVTPCSLGYVIETIATVKPKE